MKKILLMLMVVVAVALAGCGSNLTSDKPLTQEAYNKESMTSDNITLDMLFNGKPLLAGTYEAKANDGKKIRLAAIVPGDIMMRTRKPEMTILQHSSKSYVYKNGGIYHIFYTDGYMGFMQGMKLKTVQEHHVLIVDRDRKKVALFVNVKDDGSYEDSVTGKLVNFSNDDIFKTLKLQHPNG